MKLPVGKTLVSVLASLESDAEVLPFIPELLTDIDELGGSVKTVLRMLEPLAMPADSHLLDLGCGKGTACVATAKKFGFRTTGVDAFEPFVMQAQERAMATDLAGRCSFAVADIRDFEPVDPRPDVVLYLAMGALFGSTRDYVGLLRRHVRPGGYILIDDGFLKEGGGGPPRGYENYAGEAETRRQLTSFGDELAQEILQEPPDHEHVNRHILACIESRAAEVIVRHPEERNRILGYLERQKQETETLCARFVAAQWLLRRADKS